MILVTAATAPVGRSIFDQHPDAGRALTRDTGPAGLPPMEGVSGVFPPAVIPCLARAVTGRPPRSLEQWAADYPVGS